MIRLSTLALLAITCNGCMSTVVRGDREYPSGTLYPGTRTYFGEMRGLYDLFGGDPNYKGEHGKKWDRAAVIATSPLWVPDMLVLTPIVDTVALPFDLWRKVSVSDQASPNKKLQPTADAPAE